MPYFMCWNICSYFPSRISMEKNHLQENLKVPVETWTLVEKMKWKWWGKINFRCWYERLKQKFRTTFFEEFNSKYQYAGKEINLEYPVNYKTYDFLVIKEMVTLWHWTRLVFCVFFSNSNYSYYFSFHMSDLKIYLSVFLRSQFFFSFLEIHPVHVK